jgi:alcohol dehydrogenase class IV
MRFEFATAQRIVFGQGAVADLPGIALTLGRRAFVIVGKDRIRRAGILADLEAKGMNCTIFGVPGEPTVNLVREGAEALRQGRCDVAIAIGGGSVIDAGKAIAALAANPGDVLDYLEIVGRGTALPRAPVPFIAVPTTAGTGSEVTRNAVLGSPEHRVKASLRSSLMLPNVALVDPELTFALPPDITAATGLDAITQLIEPFVSIRANPITDALCRDGLRHAAQYLPRVFANGRDAEARVGMSYASLLGGLALANAGLGVVHGFAAPLGGMFDAPHGAVCATILPHGMAANLKALRQRAPESSALDRYAEIGRILTGNDAARSEDAIDWVRKLVSNFRIPSLSRYGVTESDTQSIVEKAARAGSMKANPIVLTSEELAAVLCASL